MNGFSVTTTSGVVIRFRLYSNEAPQTCLAFLQSLPFTRVLFHARYSGQEIWTDKAPEFFIPQENATVFTEVGEVVLGPQKPSRVKTAGCLGIYYGEGKGIDAANVFARVLEEDKHLLFELGNNIWKYGETELLFLPISLSH